MAYYSIGYLIKKLREQRGLSQEELAHGVMTQTSLSRLEAGIHTTNKESIDALLQRLGFNTQIHSYYLNEREYEISKKCDHLQSLIVNNKNLEANMLINELNELPELSEGVRKQFLLICKAAVMVNLREANSEIRDLATEALNITCPFYSDKYISTYYLSDQEAELINILAITYFNENNLEKAIELLESLRESLDSTRVDEKQKSKLYPLILYNLSKYYGLSEKYSEAIKVCDYAKKICIETSSYKQLPNIIYNKAYCLHALGYEKECENLIYQAYYILDGMENYEERDIIKNYAMSEMNIVIKH